jgi:hypothetical protein
MALTSSYKAYHLSCLPDNPPAYLQDYGPILCEKGMITSSLREWKKIANFKNWNTIIEMNPCLSVHFSFQLERWQNLGSQVDRYEPKALHS